MFRRFAAVILSAILLSPGWLGMTGMTLLIGFVPLLWVSASYDDTRRSWWGMLVAKKYLSPSGNVNIEINGDMSSAIYW